MGLGPVVLRLSACAALCALAGGCITPASGPLRTSVVSETSSSIPYALVKLDKHAAAILAEYEPATLAGAFTDRRSPSPITFGIGDVVSVTIFEAAAGGLFIPIEAGVRPGNFVTLPEQTVDNDGNISVPYAGSIRAAGRTNVQIQNEILARIKNRAIDPQVIVALSRQNYNLISVSGAVNPPARFPVPGLGASDRVSDAITRAGGISGQGNEAWVTMERKGRRVTVPFVNLIYQPKNDIYVQPGDRIYVYNEAQKFIAFGATGQQGEFPFNAWRINLAEAVAKAGGLFDLQADPGSVFIYRREPRDVAKKLGVDVERFKEDFVPVIFSTSFRDPGGYFVATTVQMRHGDVIFVANAAQVEIEKFLQLANAIIGTASNAVVLRNEIRAVR
jgi:polysaccharide export outer membrane protein